MQMGGLFRLLPQRITSSIVAKCCRLHQGLFRSVSYRIHTADQRAAVAAVTAVAAGGPATPVASVEASGTPPAAVTPLSTALGVLMPAVMPQSALPPLSLEETLTAVAVPPLKRNLGPRVEHIQVAAPGLLSEAVSSALQLPQWFVQELIRFGAVHYCPIMPPPAPLAAPRMSAAHLAHIQALRDAGKARHGKNPKLQVPRRATADMPVEEGGYIRVHVHPKRFPAAYSVDWVQRVLAHSQEYVVVDKPPGVQVPPTVDNLLESVCALTAAALGLPPDTLHNTHRLDVGTSGVVVLAKTAEFAAFFSGLLQDKPNALVKTYRCLTAAPPPVGPMIHWAAMKKRAAGEPAHTCILQQQQQCAVPGTASSSNSNTSSSSSSSSGSNSDGAAVDVVQAPVEGAVRCELIVEAVQQVCLTGSAAAEWGPTAYETTLQLVTGRTHQIRAQMAAVGCPLLGDQLYTVLAKHWQQQRQQEQGEKQGLGEQQGQQEEQQQPEQAVQQQQQQQGCVDQQAGQHDAPQHSSRPQHRHAGAHWSKVFQEDPSRPIGLQAARLRVRNIGRRMTAAPLGQTPQDLEQQQRRRQQQQQQDISSASEVAKQPGNANALADSVLPADVPLAEGGAEAEDWVEFVAGTPWWRA